MARKISAGLVGQPSVGAINVAPTAVVTAAENQNITLAPTGTASLVVTNNLVLNSQNDLRFGDSDSSNYVGFQAPATISSNLTWTLPATDGSADQILSTNGSGVLAWATPGIAVADNTSDSATNYVAFTTATSGSITTTRVASSKLTFQPSTGNLTVAGVVRSVVTENVQTSNYTLALTDQGIAVTMNNAGAATVTVPTNATVAFPTGTVIEIARVNAGRVTLAGAAGVTLTKTGDLGENEVIMIRKRSTDSWIVYDSTYFREATSNTPASASGYNVHTYNSDDNFVVA